MYYALFYQTVDNYIERRKPFREEHLAIAKKFHSEGKLILGGALQDPTDSALLIFKGETQDVVNQFIENDPYVKNGLIVNWQIRPWAVAIGNE